MLPIEIIILADINNNKFHYFNNNYNNNNLKITICTLINCFILKPKLRLFLN